MFADRTAAGEALARRLAALAPAHPVVLALPRGGVPVAVPIARRLGAPLDVLLVRKLGLPGQEELAAGAVVEAGGTVETVFNPDVLAMAGLGEGDFVAAIAAKAKEIAARRVRFRGGRPPAALAGRTAIVVDDGIATGATLRAALRGLARLGPAEVIVAVPVAAAEALAALAPDAPRIVCLSTPRPFLAVGAHYRDFTQVADDTVAALLADAGGGGGAGAPRG
ncbi:MAG: phosphoribosyltransferase [Rhodobacteraceae bacterium]|nr:phosphoribosyltransferase [Paracoccaceae bacterium]